MARRWFETNNGSGFTIAVRENEVDQKFTLVIDGEKWTMTRVDLERLATLILTQIAPV